MSRIHLAEPDRQHLGFGNAAVNRTGRRLRILLSYHYFGREDLDALLAKHFTEPYPEIFLDSGAFSAKTQGVNSGVMPKPEDEVFKCSFPSKQLVIDVDGNILPCCTFNGREMPLGNVADMTLEEAWASERIHGLRELHRAGGWRENPICAHCMGGEL